MGALFYISMSSSKKKNKNIQARLQTKFPCLIFFGSVLWVPNSYPVTLLYMVFHNVITLILNMKYTQILWASLGMLYDLTWYRTGNTMFFFLLFFFHYQKKNNTLFFLFFFSQKNLCNLIQSFSNLIISFWILAQMSFYFSQNTLFLT